ncbi:MAG: hypothetical protein ACKO1Y_08075 [Actinomycetota bacterium]
MGALRRLAATALAAAGLVAVAPTAPAGAHLCPVTSIVPPGETAAVPIAVTVEQTPVAAVEITFPDGLRLDRFRSRAGWTATRTGPVVRVQGPPIAAYSCAYFSAAVTPLRRGVFSITMVQRDRTGAVVARSTPGLPDPANPYGAQRVYAGVDPPKPPSAGPDPVMVAGTILVVLALLAAGGRAVVSARARRHEDREAEIEDRLEAFLSEPGRAAAGAAEAGATDPTPGGDAPAP